jgi:hypothetical protein
MEIVKKNDELVIHAELYSLRFPVDRPFVFLDSAQGDRLLELFVLSSVHPINGRDETYHTTEWTTQETAYGVNISITAKSSVWKSKTYRFCCYPNRFTYHIEIDGEGRLADINYFGGYYSENIRWGSGFFWSGQQFSQMFNPEPNVQEVFYHTPAGNTKIDLMGVPIPAKGDWFFTPPPFCFAGKYADGWLALGVEAQPGANSFTEYHYHGSLDAFYLSLAYEGHTQVSGQYELPAIGFDFAKGEYAALKAHVAALRAANFVPVPQNDNKPSWWRTPIFCGWGSQCHLASVDGGRAPEYARQENYDHFLAALEQNGIDPGIVVLDDKWQLSYGENQVDEDKWPDLPGFVAKQHGQGRRVLLWLKAWDPEGLPVEECVTHSGGEPVAVDPTNPAFERRLRASVRRMLSSEGYDADGFKIDFTARIPSGPGLQIHKDIWGLELMKLYLSIIYSEAKKTKPDALIMTHTPHPYLGDVLDMIRLNDINTGQDVNRAMIHRAKVAALACPEAIIDTDNWPMTNKAVWRDYLKIQPELGVPSLYFATHVDSTGEPLTDEDYALIRQVWSASQSK